jgi:hypothetical protein
MTARRAHVRGGDVGGVMILVLLALMMIGAVTTSVMQLIAAEVGGGIRELQSGQARNIAQAGVHYAIGRLQLAGAHTYAGETITVTHENTALGKASITVNCPDTGAAPPCSGPYAGYRRIISTGTLPVGGSARTIVAVVQATTGGASGICSFRGGVGIGGATTVFSNVGANAAITLAGGSLRPQIRGDRNVPQRFTGSAAAMGPITCGGSSCGTQVQGEILPAQPRPVCPALTPPAYARSSANLYIGRGGFTMNNETGYAWNDVRLAPGACSGPGPFTDLYLQADPSNPNAKTIVQINTLIMGNCSRVVILGVGRIELRIAEPRYAGLVAFANSRLAVLPRDTLITPAPVPASRFVVWINANGAASGTDAAQFVDAQLVAGTILAPNGRIFSSNVPKTIGAFWGYTVSVNGDGSFLSDTSGVPLAYADFKQLRSWKEE